MLYNYKYFVKCLIVFNVLCLLVVVGKSSFLEDNYSKSVIEDASLDTAQLLQKYKYPSETHYVTTKDNYILRMHRIPKPGAPPVFMMHGLLDSSSTWILMGPKRGLGYYLHDNGFDIWMGNARGNRYSRNHTTLNPNTDNSFWTFSWHEIGVYDLPAMIDYILNQTSYKKIGYFGHSQGTTAFFVMASLIPEYNSKITMMHALAPVVFMQHLKSPLMATVKSFVISAKDAIREYLPRTEILWRTCFTSKFAERTCLALIDKSVGIDEQQFDMAKFPTMIGHFPAGCNLKQFVHYMQQMDSNRFCQFDYGTEENQKLYGSNSPPDYPLDKITVPVGLYYALDDYLASEIDVQHLAKLLPNVVDDCLYPYKKWGHISMTWGKDARELAHKRMFENMKNFSYEVDK